MKVSSLHIYPVKSCAGIEVREADVFARGLQHDRRWMVVDMNGRFMTQRDWPQMALINVTITGQGLQLSVPGQAAMSVVIPTGPLVQVAVWKSSLALPMADEAVNEYLSDFMGHPCRLVYLPDSITRDITSSRGKPGDEVSLADGFPVLIATTASLVDLNARLEKPLPMNRFRPNVVIEGADAWGEDSWHMVQIGGVQFELPKPCTRCNLTQVDQQRGEEDGKEPIRTLRKFRFSLVEAGVLFGMNATPRSAGVIKAGDDVIILSRQEPAPLLQRA